MPRTNILVFAGSTRSGSLSGKLAAVAAKEIALLDTDVTLISLGDYPLPLFDGGVPTHDNVIKLAKLIAEQQGVFVATPEHNHSIPSLLKNMIDWVSRQPHSATLPYRNKVWAVTSISDGPVGGARALVDLRRILITSVRAILVPEKIEVSNGQSAFNEAGELIDDGPAKQLRAVCRQLVDLARRVAD